MRSLQSALRVLTEFSKGDAEKLSVRDLCARTGLSKSQVSKILADFRGSGLLVQDPETRDYAVGLRALALAGQFLNTNRLSRTALGPMRELVDLTGHTATLCVLEDLDIMYLVSVESTMFINHGWRVGAWVPFHATAAGKVLVADLPEEAIDRIIGAHGLPRFTPSTVCNVAVLKVQLKQVRKRGIAITHSEGTPGLGAQAVPVFGRDQAVIGALGLVYADHLVSAKASEHLTGVLHDHARVLSHQMGATVYPFGSAIRVSRPGRAGMRAAR